jgi:hypothetical protein
MKEKCLPCIIHNQAKTLKEIIEPAADKFCKEYAILDECDISERAYNKRWRAIRDPFDAILKEYGVEEVDALEDAMMMETIDGVYECYYHSQSEQMYVRKLK